MDDKFERNKGLQQLIQKYIYEFRRPENTDFYSETDYRDAERKYIKHRLTGRVDA
jgi:hypothetical protein